MWEVLAFGENFVWWEWGRVGVLPEYGPCEFGLVDMDLSCEVYVWAFVEWEYVEFL